MDIITKPEDMRAYSFSARNDNRRIGFVPTMGFLHPGHLSLAALVKNGGRCDRTVMSIFVNPLQFGPHEDFEKYPRDIERDTKMAREAGIDVLFYPERGAMYTSNDRTVVEVREMSEVMCGLSRPGHFRGVTTVVAKLLNIVRPHAAVFGQKDAQQFFIIRRMVEDLRMDVELLMAPIVRETDGLAMSSRNVYLDPEERAEAVCLSQALNLAQDLVRQGVTDCSHIIRSMRAHIAAFKTARIDYSTVVDAETLNALNEMRKPALIALAVYFGKTRLIDNALIT